MPRVVAAPDKFRGTATAAEVAQAVAAAARAAGWACDQVPVADGGEGLLEVMPGRLRTTEVLDPLGRQVQACWRLDGTAAVVEMARASGLALVGGPEGNDPVAATTAGTGQLIAAAVKEGARHLIIGVGGSATTDGGLGAVRALEPHSRLHGVRLTVACDVTTPFLEAAATFSPQKGATPAQVQFLARRLEGLATLYQDDYGVDVRPLPGGGAAGGLAGGLAAIGAELVPGFEVVADAVELADHLEGADLVVTGEGLLDEQSFSGKAVGGVVALAAELGVGVLVVAGDVEGVGGEPLAGEPLAGESLAGESLAGESLAGVRWVSLVERFGRERALGDTLACVTEAVAEHLASISR